MESRELDWQFWWYLAVAVFSFLVSVYTLILWYRSELTPVFGTQYTWPALAALEFVLGIRFLTDKVIPRSTLPGET